MSRDDTLIRIGEAVVGGEGEYTMR
jgi:hypothetical protein